MIGIGTPSSVPPPIHDRGVELRGPEHDIDGEKRDLPEAGQKQA